MTTLTISKKGWIVIPAKMRQKYNLQPGSQVVIVDYGGVLSIVPAVDDPVSHGKGLLKDSPGLVADLLEERAGERGKEDSEFNGK